LSEARRILRPGGKLILSTPDRDVFSAPGVPPAEFHVHELSRAEFETLLSRYFANIALFSQRILVGSAILRHGGDPARVPPLVFERQGETHVEMSDGLPRARYLLAVASDANEDLVPGSLFIDTGDLADPRGRATKLERDYLALIERIDRDRTIQVTDLNRRHSEEMRAGRADERATAEAQIVELQHRGAMRVSVLEDHVRRAREEVEASAARDFETARSLRRLALEHDAMLASASWRLLSAARRAATRFPRLARSARGGAKLAYWTATLQVAPRIRARRRAGADIATLATSSLFDRVWYLARYPEVTEASLDPILHYYWTRAAAGYDPHPLFDSAWYLAVYPEPARLGQNPLAHYIRAGSAAGHDPHPLFDGRLYLAGRPHPATTVLEHYLAHTPLADLPPTANAMFDAAMYLAEYPTARASGLDPLIHYITTGAAVGHAPHPLFDAGWYSARSPDCARFPANPAVRAFAHFLRVGLASSAFPSALMEACGTVFSSRVTLAFRELESPEVSVIVPAYGHLFQTFRCLCAVLWRTGAVPHEVILADDRPDAPIAAALARFAGLRFRINHTNLGFLRSCNEAAKLARGRHLVFLNNDTEVDADWLAPLAIIADADATVGMVGCKLLRSDGTIEEAGGILRNDGWGEPYGYGGDTSRGEYNFVRDVDCVIGACFLVPRAHWEAAGGFDDAYAPAYYEEFDLAVALRQRGLRVVYQPASEVRHHGSATYGFEARDRQSSINHARFRRKWARFLATRPTEHEALFTARDSRANAGVALVIDDKVPQPDRSAGGLALFQYLVLLHDLGLKVVYCPADMTATEPYTGHIRQRGIEVVHTPDTLTGWLSRNGRHVDYVWIARPSIAAEWLDTLRRMTGAPIFYFTHDLHHLREMRRFEIEGDWRAREESTRLKRQELAIFARVDVVLSVSVAEAEFIQRDVPTATVRAIPPFLFVPSTLPAFPTADSFAERRDIVFVGGFDHLPNVDAAIWLAREIYPLIQARAPQARLVILGNQPPSSVTALAGPGVEVVGYVPDLAPYYANARMSLSPLRYGAGVKGKVFGSLQAGIPVVTTLIGSEGIGLQDGVDALIGETASEIAECAVGLFEDPHLCARIAAAGETLAREKFSVERATRVMRELFEIEG